MADKYISQEWLINAIKDRIAINTHPDPILSMMQKHECQEILQLIESAPAEDVAPVVHGRWVPAHEGLLSVDGLFITSYRCSECGRGIARNPSANPYCHCGAKMDGKEHDHV